jgi:hypothetical protein
VTQGDHAVNKTGTGTEKLPQLVQQWAPSQPMIGNSKLLWNFLDDLLNACSSRLLTEGLPLSTSFLLVPHPLKLRSSCPLTEKASVLIFEKVEMWYKDINPFQSGFLGVKTFVPFFHSSMISFNSVSTAHCAHTMHSPF